ncbi:hypothetical protein J2Z32_002778 [Paenibacillus turicensis]|uniref:Uncharacterized protein n=1 Tax=Paenibacillus turicensis TaxID=160487 RepID=A0ABS4FUB1_9BACL|nr:hypothetical protein [Paenibacillus turicensis]MBP1906129.1 hypothetical protein [Paenibacillus turicensis]
MDKKNHWNWIQISAILIFILLVTITLSGIFSYSTQHKYVVTNLYGQSVEIYGYGVYQHDSYFKAPILIGSDWAMLLMVVPLIGYYVMKGTTTFQSKTSFFPILGIVLYYAFSISFGVAYNQLQLAYILLTAVAFFTLFSLLINIIGETKDYTCNFDIKRGELSFLIVAGVANIIAWLPDILSSLFTGQPLMRIEMYTTEITYVLDMGIISPLVFITVYLLVKKKSVLALLLYRMILVTLKIIGFMLPIQTVVQLLAGIEIPLPELITKVVLFVILACMAIYFDRRNKKRMAKVIAENKL